MRNFWGFYINGRYKAGLSGTVWVYDMEDQLIGRFTETPYSYSGLFVPGTDIFVCHTNECHLVVYDIANLRMLKKIRTSNCGVAESWGMAFSNDGKRLYCIQAQWDTCLKSRLVVYDTENFEVKETYFDGQGTLVPEEIEFAQDGTCYIYAGERKADSGAIDRKFVGIFRDGELVERREFQEKWLTVAMYFAWKRSGFTEKSYQNLLKGCGFDREKHREPSTLKKLYETGYL